MDQSVSPRWNPTTKLVVAFTMVALVLALVVKFQSIVSPLILSFTFVYLLYPVADFIRKRLHLSWGASVGIVYLLLVMLLLSGVTVTSLELFSQIKSAITLVNNNLDRLPELVDEVSTFAWTFGPFRLDLSTLDLSMVSDNVIGWVQGLVSEAGLLLTSLASGAANTFGWGFFILLASYFMLAESGGLREGILRINIPGYQKDFERMGLELGRIWNAFLRGQFILVGIAFIVYSVLLSGMGVRYALGLALMSGLARFVPYVGPFISWTALAFVAFFQVFKLFGMSPWLYTTVVLVVAFVVDGILDNYVSPRIMAETLKVHPAAVLVAAIIALELLGLLGVMIAAPMLATAQLGGRYILRKLFDMPPWEGLEESPAPPPLRQQVQVWWKNLLMRFNFLRKK